MTDTSAEALRFRATVRHDEAEVGDLPYLEEFWAVRASDYATLLTERDRYKARAEQAEKALYRIQNMSYGKNAAIARATLAQIDAEPAEPRQPAVKPLEWDWTGGYGLICKADTQIGAYSIHQDEDSAAGALLMYLHLTEEGDCTRYAIEWHEYLEPEEMQAIAQADYERRILSALAELMEDTDDG